VLGFATAETHSWPGRCSRCEARRRRDRRFSDEQPLPVPLQTVSPQPRALEFLDSVVPRSPSEVGGRREGRALEAAVARAGGDGNPAVIEEVAEGRVGRVAAAQLLLTM